MIKFIVISQKQTEEQLVSSLKAKQQEGFNYLYKHYSSALYGLIFRVLKDEDLAQEALHDAFMRIWDRIETYDPEISTLYTWMARICRNLAIDVTRSKTFKKSSKTDAVEDNVYAVDKQYHSQFSSDAIGLEDMVLKLKQDQRFIIESLYFKGYTQSEISEEFDIPLGTVKTRTRGGIGRA